MCIWMDVKLYSLSWIWLIESFVTEKASDGKQMMGKICYRVKINKMREIMMSISFSSIWALHIFSQNKNVIEKSRVMNIWGEVG